MESSVTAERGSWSVENMFALIRFEAQTLGLCSQQRANGLFIFHPNNFAEGIQSLSRSSMLLYTEIETEGGDSPYTVDLWPLEALVQVAHTSKLTYVQNQGVMIIFFISSTCFG